MNFIVRLKKLLSKREKKFLGLLFFSSVIISFLESIGISLVTIFAAVATNLRLVFSNKYYSFAYKFFNFSTPENFVIVLGISLVAFYLFRGLFIAFHIYASRRFAQGRYRKFALKFFENYIAFQYKDFTSTNSSDISKIVFEDAVRLTQILDSILIISSEGLTIIFIYSALLFVSLKTTLVLTFLLGINVFFILKFFTKKLNKSGRKGREFSVDISRIYNESFWNFKLIKLASTHKKVSKRFDEACKGIVKTNTINMLLQSIPRLLLETIGLSLLISVMVYVVYLYNDASSIIPMISMYGFAFYRFLPSMNKIIASYNLISFNSHVFDSVDKYLSKNLEVLGNNNLSFGSSIKFSNVSFEYTKKNKVLSSVNLIIKKGQRVAFVGKSGCGKSTLVDMIMGLYRPLLGTISIDGIKLDNSNIKSWRGKIGYIPQQVYLFDGTVAQNVVFNRKYDKEKVILALKKSNIYDFLLTKDGIESKVGEGGIQISGGQKQRIAIARALYTDPEILILDEATSALDTNTENKIMEEIYSLNKDKTLIVIAHRLTTLEKCEIIYKIEKGSIFRVDNLHALYDQKSTIMQKQL